MNDARMINTASKLLVAGLLAVLPVSAESAGKIHVCVNPGKGTPMWVLIRAEGLASRMFSTAGVGLDWHFADAAVCRELRQADTVRLDFVVNTPPGDHPGVLAYTRVYEGTHIVVLFDRIETTAGIFQTSSVLAHVMTHEITHVLQGVARHSEIGVMKAQWERKDLQRMIQHPLSFTSVDIELIQLGLAQRAVRSASAAPVPIVVAPRSPITPKGTFGDAGRNTVIGPRANIADFSALESTRISERVNPQFRSEFFDIFNHPNLALPAVTVNSSGFGSIASTVDVSNGNPLGDGGPRLVQFALKLVF
jgi:hypothetical protein